MPKSRSKPSSPAPKRTLNTAQRQAADVVDGPVLVIAGAGTGKTHTLIHRLVHLVEAGVPPESILLLTFTRRAAQEMIGRASEILGGRCDRVGGGTFHSFANMMLRRYGPAIELDRDFTVIDQGDSFEILSGIRSELGLSKRERRFPQRTTISAILSKAVNKQVSIETILDEEYPQFVHEEEPLVEIDKRYRKYKTERRLLDFDDLLVELVHLLEASAETRSRVLDRYRYVMVDEYQDTNILQAHITRLLAGTERNILVVGDDAQSIYAFRGANYRNLFDFNEEFDDARLIKLEENYRSTKPVLDVANALMEQMSEAFKKELFTRRDGGELPRLVEAATEDEQARFITSEIERFRERGVPLSEMAVLFRASRHAFPLEVELQRADIPYVKYGGFRFLEAAHIKDVLAHLRVLANPSDDLSLIRVLMLQGGIGRTGAQKIQSAVAGKPASQGLKEYPGRGKVKASVGRLSKLFGRLEELQSSPVSCLQEVIEDYEPMLQERFDDWPRRKRDLEQLVVMCERYRSLTSMLTDFSLDPPTRSSRDNLAGETGEDRLILSTMHSAKGLEWKVVFIIQAVDGYIPMVSRYDDEEDEERMDEELRLFYVAVTRAKDTLCVVWPGETPRSSYLGWSMPSRFITSMPEELFQVESAYRLMRS